MSQVHRSWAASRGPRSLCQLVVAGLAVLGLGINLTHAQLVLSGGGLTLVEEGPAALTAGGPVPTNLATGATPFSHGDLGPVLDITYHVAANLNDQQYGNGFSWIGIDPPPFPDRFAGIDLGGLVENVQSIAFGRSNVLSGDPCLGGACNDRHLGSYTLQYTQVADPSSNLALPTTGMPSTGWADIGSLTYGASEGVGTNYNMTWQRHRYNFNPVDATGIRLVLGQPDTAIDEIELYDTPGAYVEPPPPPPPFAILSNAGYAISWDGNDGDHFDPNPPPGGALAPDNLALAARGAVAFTSSDLGPEIGAPNHVVANVNDGFYGNGNSWIGGTTNPFPVAFAGVNLGGLHDVTHIAFGRDNGNGAIDDSIPGTDACGGQCDDRWQGLYMLQYTQVDDPSAMTADTGDPTTGWVTIGSVNYATSLDSLVGEDFSGFLRHEFAVSQNGQPLSATAVRLVVPQTGLALGTAIDELEVFNRPVPEPSGLVLLVLGILPLVAGRRR